MLTIEHPLKRIAAGAVDAGLTVVAGPWALLRRISRERGLPVRGPERILLVRLDHIGDFVLSLPAMAMVRRQWPDAHVTAAVGSWAEPIARLARSLDEVRVIDPPWWQRARGVRPDRMRWRRDLRNLQREMRDCDLAIDFRGDMRQILHFLWGTRASVRAALDRSGAAALLTHAVSVDPEMHVAQQALELLRALGVDGEPPSGPHLREDAEAGEWVAQRLSQHFGEPAPRFALVHVGARAALRAWPPERFGPVLDHLAERHGLGAVLAGDEADRDRAGRAMCSTTSGSLNLCGETSLLHAVSLARRASLFLGNDSGLMHLAGACNTPVVGLFGPNHPRRCGPVGVPSRVCRRDFPCSPCLQIRCPLTDQVEGQCMQDLTVEEVRAATDDLMVEVGAA
jgi:ADP-heptose:LPS heptosyltransferase